MQHLSIARFILIVATLGIAAFDTAAADSAGANATLATVAGTPIHESDVLPLIRAQLEQLRNQEYQLKSRALESVINQKLLDMEAASRSMSVEELLKREVEPNVRTPTDRDIEIYYASQKDALNRPLDEIRTEIRQALDAGNRQIARADYLQQLRRKAGVNVWIVPPKVDVAIDSQRLRGDASAAVTIVEFSDFQCPFCRQALPTVKLLLERYGKQVRLAYRDFPLTQIHPDAQMAAEASHCALEQGRFWEYHDALFANQAKLDHASLVAYARNLKLDGDAFEQCLTSGKFKAAINKDFSDGVRAGVSATPTFFINGVLLSGAQPLETFTRMIDEELARATTAVLK